MAKKKSSDKKPIEQYDHKEKKRVNNPPIGLVTPETDKEARKSNVGGEVILRLFFLPFSL